MTTEYVHEKCTACGTRVRIRMGGICVFCLRLRTELARHYRTAERHRAAPAEPPSVA